MFDHVRSEAFFDEEEELKNYKSRLLQQQLRVVLCAQRSNQTCDPLNSSIAVVSVIGCKKLSKGCSGRLNAVTRVATGCAGESLT